MLKPIVPKHNIDKAIDKARRRRRILRWNALRRLWAGGLCWSSMPDWCVNRTVSDVRAPFGKKRRQYGCHGAVSYVRQRIFLSLKASMKKKYSWFNGIKSMLKMWQKKTHDSRLRWAGAFNDTKMARHLSRRLWSRQHSILLKTSLFTRRRPWTVWKTRWRFRNLEMYLRLS